MNWLHLVSSLLYLEPPPSTTPDPQQSSEQLWKLAEGIFQLGQITQLESTRARLSGFCPQLELLPNPTSLPCSPAHGIVSSQPLPGSHTPSLPFPSQPTLHFFISILLLKLLKFGFFSGHLTNLFLPRSPVTSISWNLMDTFLSLLCLTTLNNMDHFLPLGRMTLDFPLLCLILFYSLF